MFQNMASKPTPTRLYLGRALHTASTVLMVLLLLLAAKGFNITRGRLRQNSAVRLTAFMCMYIVTCLCLFIYEQQVNTGDKKIAECLKQVLSKYVPVHQFIGILLFNQYSV
uniref:GPR180/TMEM145 transmembrane domain-containing protein n=1 Tax=Scylla olivacea TaxID=85551 RepID=A0A0N7Z9R8_SCYOL